MLDPTVTHKFYSCNKRVSKAKLRNKRQLQKRINDIRRDLNEDTLFSVPKIKKWFMDSKNFSNTVDIEGAFMETL